MGSPQAWGVARRRGTKLRENNLRVTCKKYYEMHAINSDKSDTTVYVFWVGNT